jgi:hypothetical protein
MIELWAVEAFCLSPVIACLFFVSSVLSMLGMQVAAGWTIEELELESR